MESYAVIETGGQQFMVKSGDVVEIDRLSADAGSTVDFDKVLAYSDGETLTTGTPTIDGGKVSAEVVEHFRGKKVVAFKKKKRHGYKRKVGHRQELTRVKIGDIKAA